jgi:hypothetical protein
MFYYVGFDVLMAKKNNVFWDITPHIPVEFHGRFCGKYCLHFQGGRDIHRLFHAVS